VIRGMVGMLYKGCQIALPVMTRIDTIVFANVLYQLTDDIPLNSGYFHAQFHTGRNPGPDPMHIADVTTAGHYAGCALSMQAQEVNWLSFLEAPEYIYVDDDWEYPRIVGTGLEDYFLGGWYFREGAFIGPYHGVPIKDAQRASVAMYRVHESDAIRFRERLKFVFVHPWESERLRPFAYSSVAFLYLNSPKGTGKLIPSYEDLMCWYRIRNAEHRSLF
jgi:hypothetical protein